MSSVMTHARTRAKSMTHARTCATTRAKSMTHAKTHATLCNSTARIIARNATSKIPVTRARRRPTVVKSEDSSYLQLQSATTLCLL
ncbi:uncharacterized protein LOC128639845 isoform X3 [Bombina bombina]|uniref:uncharacterized protein LOC128639845 isoform X3 n=1 Tax=Bombina bombina TaxID=8345 RepID=UPI00235B03D0|nr:uncharacterized protein LOC128639845 isoform X3 [Bombina bombina]XP_053548028.1 uncharacterized protein LOC128639845 isoform X3 [Bombina bombina]XP_053548029.1 uncharacterized protein LOC128639845 isoform X3 [Bombina bombina]XP_053548030.1 uncharacterized protein LOC128639845 isoform X3 [Bombina bombina]